MSLDDRVNTTISSMTDTMSSILTRYFKACSVPFYIQSDVTPEEREEIINNYRKSLPEIYVPKDVSQYFINIGKNVAIKFQPPNSDKICAIKLEYDIRIHI